MIGPAMTPEILARIAAARAARDLADLARQAVGTAAETSSVTERILAARRLRKVAADIMDLTVLAEVLAGAGWIEVTEAMGRLDPGTVEAEFKDAVAEWGGFTDEAMEAAVSDIEGLDAWYARHREDHDPAARKPVADLLHRR
jgi:hypothetical protein